MIITVLSARAAAIAAATPAGVPPTTTTSYSFASVSFDTEMADVVKSRMVVITFIKLNITGGFLSLVESLAGAYLF